MANRKPIKQREFKTWWNPPSGTGEINNEPSCTIQEESVSTEDIVKKYLRGDLTINRRGVYDSNEVRDIPATRKRGASIASVTAEARNALVNDVLRQEAQRKEANKKKNSPIGESKGSPEPAKDSKES